MENLQNEQMDQQNQMGSEEMAQQIASQILPDAEWCFQFGEEEPVVFAWSNEDDTEAVFNLTIPAIQGTAASFKCPNTGKTFNIMVRPMSEETKAAREATKAESSSENQ